MTLFGGGFSALPVLRTLFVSPRRRIGQRLHPGLFAVAVIAGAAAECVPFFGYLIDGWVGALIATLALFVPSGLPRRLAQRHLRQLKTNPRFETRDAAAARGHDRVSRGGRIDDPRMCRLKPAYLLTALSSAMCFAKLKVPVYAVYATVAAVFGLWLAYGALP